MQETGCEHVASKRVWPNLETAHQWHCCTFIALFHCSQFQYLFFVLSWLALHSIPQKMRQHTPHTMMISTATISTPLTPEALSWQWFCHHCPHCHNPCDNSTTWFGMICCTFEIMLDFYQAIIAWDGLHADLSNHKFIFIHISIYIFNSLII